MLDVLFSFLSSFRMYFQSSAEVQLEIHALRHQIAVLQRKTPKPKLTSADRRLWVWLSRSWFRWRSALVVVKPDTVINWHPSRFPLVLDMEGSTRKSRTARRSPRLFDGPKQPEPPSTSTELSRVF